MYSQKGIEMMTKEQAFKRIHAIEAIRKRTNHNPGVGYRWTINVNPVNLKELIICRYSSIVSGFGFFSRHDAKEFMNNPENLKLLKEAYL